MMLDYDWSYWPSVLTEREKWECYQEAREEMGLPREAWEWSDPIAQGQRLMMMTIRPESYYGAIRTGRRY